MSESIPVIGTAIVNNPFWVHRLIMSVDYPVDEFVVFNNNGRDQITEELDLISKINHKFIKKIRICHLPSNIGCPAAWNMIIKCYLMSPYWIIVNHDVAFTAGFLRTMVEKAEDQEVGMVHADGGEHNIGTWEIFLLKDWVVKRYGLFDENFYPGYSEDSDYLMRIFNDPIKRDLSVGVPYYHGETMEYSISGSQTLRSEPELKEKLDHARMINEYEYMDKKWGTGWRYCTPLKKPYGKNDVPLSYSEYDLDFIRKKHLGF